MESKRQQQLGSEIQRIMSSLFHQEVREILEQAFVTISSVQLTPDLLIAKIYITVLQADKQDAVLSNLRANSSGIRGLLGNQLKNKVRRIPEVEFFMDESLDRVFEIEELLKENKDKTEEE